MQKNGKHFGKPRLSGELRTMARPINSPRQISRERSSPLIVSLDGSTRALSFPQPRFHEKFRRAWLREFSFIRSSASYPFTAGSLVACSYAFRVEMYRKVSVARTASFVVGAWTRFPSLAMCYTIKRTRSQALEMKASL